ncbi:helix-turn-helix transcriptional regulator [Streptomyces sp. NPDC097617]|uniref:helix-turn-helix transcriptional regulator n=1 Tax=Streptomyces sp. NPDC097617 TaxID=3366091 RepID=UPI0037F5442F
MNKLVSKSRPTLAVIRSWPATIGIPQAAEALGCSKSHLHERIKAGQSPVKTIPFGSRHVVITADLIRLLSGEEREAS